MFLGKFNTIFFNFSNNLFHLELKIRTIQIDLITSYVVMSNAGIKRVDLFTSQVLVYTSLAPFYASKSNIRSFTDEKKKKKKKKSIF